MPEKPVPALKGRIIRGMLFDLGDTLWSRKDASIWQHMEGASNHKAIALLRQHVSPALLPALDDKTLGQGLRDSLDEQVRAAIRLDPGREPDCALAIVQTLHQWGIDAIDRDLGAAIFDALRVRIPVSRPLFDDVLPTLAELRQRGFLLGVVTNRLWGGKVFHEDVQTLGLLNHFDYSHMAISADLGVRKPHPAIFQHALNAIQVPPEQAVMVGDSLRADIAGAQGLGIFSIWKPKPAWRSHIHAIPVKPGANSATAVDTTLYHVPTSAELPSGEQVEVPPPGVLISDDDFVLSASSHDSQPGQSIRGTITPDLIIENIGDLLDIFSEAGKQ